MFRALIGERKHKYGSTPLPVKKKPTNPGTDYLNLCWILPVHLIRQAQKNRVVSVEDADITGVMDEIEEPLDELHRENLIKVLDTLEEKDLQLIEMRFFEQKPFKEIAEILDMTESNAKVKTYRILERLKTKLTKLSD